MARRPSFQRYPLFDAIQKKDIKRIRYLVQTGDSPNSMNENGISALGFAITDGNKKIVEFLLQNGADPNRRGTYEEYPLFTALDKKNTDIIKLLLRYKADPYLQNRKGETVYNLVERSKSKILKEVFGTSVETKPYFSSKIDQEYYEYLLRTFNLEQLRRFAKNLSIPNSSVLRKEELALSLITSFGKYLKDAKVYQELFPFYFSSY